MTNISLDTPARQAQPGDALPTLSLPITASLIVTGALATRDFQPIHHDSAYARARGFKDIFMNILTTQGLVTRYVTDWAGGNVQIKRNNITLGAPNYPGDTMTMTGSVAARRAEQTHIEIDVAVNGANGIGTHVSGLVTIMVPASEGKAR